MKGVGTPDWDYVRDELIKQFPRKKKEIENDFLNDQLIWDTWGAAVEHQIEMVSDDIDLPVFTYGRSGGWWGITINEFDYKEPIVYCMLTNY